MEETSPDHDLLVRIDERTQTLHSVISDIKSGMAAYVTKKEFAPVKLIVYGAVGVMGVAILGAVISLILKR